MNSFVKHGISCRIKDSRPYDRRLKLKHHQASS
jgi:hypothetical protein